MRRRILRGTAVGALAGVLLALFVAPATGLLVASGAVSGLASALVQEGR